MNPLADTESDVVSSNDHEPTQSARPFRRQTPTTHLNDAQLDLIRSAVAQLSQVLATLHAMVARVELQQIEMGAKINAIDAKLDQVLDVLAVVTLPCTCRSE